MNTYSQTLPLVKRKSRVKTNTGKYVHYTDYTREMNILVLASYNTRTITIHDFEISSKMGYLTVFPPPLSTVSR